MRTIADFPGRLGELARTRMDYRELWGITEEEIPFEGAQPVPQLPCAYLGGQTGQRLCASCGGKVEIKLFACAIHGQCTLGKRLDGLACCQGCTDRA